MMLHCPCCHAQFSIEAVIQDEEARRLIGMKGEFPPALFAYLSLFRSEKRALAWDRMTRLTVEVLAIGEQGAGSGALNEAMAETVEALRGKGGAPLKNHNYLKKVLLNRGNVESLNRLNSSTPQQFNSSTASSSKTDAAINSLDGWHCGDWVRIAVASGLAGLLALRLENSPAADTITKTADIWEQAVRPKASVQDLDAPRIAAAFRLLFTKSRKWPGPAQLVELMPIRKPQKALDNEISSEERAANRERLRELVRSME